jgi:hypothetical protein
MKRLNLTLNTNRSELIQDLKARVGSNKFSNQFRIKNIIILWVIAMLLISCNNHNYTMKTEILPDGSCIREFTTNADSAFMVGDTVYNPFPMRLDRSWEISYANPDSGGKLSTKWPAKRWYSRKDTAHKIVPLRKISIKKKFSSVKALQDSFHFNHSDWEVIHPKLSLEKRFKWFYTTYSFKEVYPKFNKLHYAPIEKYLTNEEIKWYFKENPMFESSLTGKEIKDTLDEIDNKVNDWLTRNMFEETFQALTEGLKKFEPDNPYLKSIILSKDTLFNLYKSEKPLEGDLEKVIKKHFKIKKVFSNGALAEKIDDYLKNQFDPIFQPIGSIFTYELIMPGKVMETNSNKTDVKSLTWKLDGYRIYFTDYEIYAKSRVANWWAFVVSGIFILLVGLSFFVKRK